MKKIKKIMAVILTVVLLFTGIPMMEISFADIKASAIEEEEPKLYEDFLYRIEKDEYGVAEGITIAYYIGNKKDVVIPDMIENLPVIQIRDRAFDANSSGYYGYRNYELINIESISIPDTVEVIGTEAFDSLNKLREMKLPANLRIIGNYAFKDCTSLETLEFGNKVESLGWSFLINTNVKEIVIPGGAGVELTISEKAFYGAYLNKIVIKSDYVKVEDEAFCYNKGELKELIFEGNVTYWGSNVCSSGDAFPERLIFKSEFVENIYEEIAGTCEKIYTDDFNNTGWTVFFKNEADYEWLTYGDYKCFLKNGKIVIAEYIKTYSSPSRLVIPEMLGGKEVSEIGYAAFRYVGFREVTIPSTVEKIGSYAFGYCKSLEKVNHSGSINTFGSHSFRMCKKLTEFVIPEQVTEIPDSMFEDCSMLTNVVAKGVISVGKSAFDYCELLKSVQLSSELNTVKERAFYCCKELESIGTNGENITELGKHAFENTAIKSFVFSGDLATIPDSCFYNSQISQITISQGIENIEGHAFYDCENLEAIILPDSLKTIGDSAFMHCENATEFKLSENIKTIGKYAFYGCEGIKEDKLIIDKNVESIGDYAFSGMSFDSLYYNCIDFRAISVYNNEPTYTDAFKGVIFKEITIGPDVRLLCEKIFEGQNEITNLTIPENVKIIEESAFANCTKLEALIIKDGIEEIMDNAFSGCSSLTEFTVPVTLKKFAGTALPNNLTTCYFNAENCVFTSFASSSYDISVSPFQSSLVETVVIGNTVKRIPDYFLAHYHLSKDVIIPNSVIEIGEYAFAHSLIKDVRFSSNLVLIEKGAFRFSKIQNRGRFLPDSLRIIGTSAFEECQSLTEIYFPDSVVHIDESAFYNCEYITKVRMSPNVKYLKDSAFSTCVTLKEFEWNSDVKLIGENTFRSCKALSDFDFQGVELLYPSSFLNSGVKTVVLGEDKNEEASALVSIEEQSFKSCADLETLSIGGNVATIKSQAFAECENLETAVISESVINIASDAFDGCDSLTICCMEDSYAYDYAVENNIPVTTFVIAPIPNQVYTGDKIEPDVNVSMSDKQLEEKVDFSVKYSNNINIGTAKVNVRGKGIYKALASIANFTIITKDIGFANIVAIADQNYTGNPVTPSITVTDGTNILREGTDYTVTYKNNTKVGTATVTLQGTGNYSGTKSVEFNINELTFFQRVKNAFLEFFAIIKAWFTSIFS